MNFFSFLRENNINDLNHAGGAAMAKKQIEQEDPWAGFVDVLSNVVMVVTFIIILLGIAMLVLSQQIAKSMAESLLKQSQQASGIGEASGIGITDAEGMEAPPPPNPSEEAPPDSAKPETDKVAVDVTTAVNPNEATGSKEGSELSAGTRALTTDRPLLQPDEIEGDTTLTVRSREVDPEAEVAATEAKSSPKGGEIVTSSDAVVSVRYDNGAFELTQDGSAPVIDAVKSVEAAGGAESGQRYEVVAIATSSLGSLSEARRLAFYRGMRLRSLLLQAGVDAGRIRVTVRESDAPEDFDRAFVFAQPD